MHARAHATNVQALHIAGRITGDTLSDDAKRDVMEWARKHHATRGEDVTPLEQVMVTRTLKAHEGAFSPEERGVLRDLYEQGYTRLVGKAPAKDTLERLPTWATEDARVRVLQNAVFERHGLLAGYRPSLADVAMLGGLTAVAAVAPAMTAAALGGLAAASAVEHQIHVHVMHATPENIRLMNRHADNPIVKPAWQFYLVHKVAHHGGTFRDNDVTKWRPGDKERFYASIDDPKLRKFFIATEEGLCLTPLGMVVGAGVGVAASSAAALLTGLALGFSATVVAPVALAFGLPMALMPMFPHYLHRFSHMSRADAAEYLDAQRKSGTFGKLKSAAMEKIIATRAFRALARFHNQHHADDNHRTLSNMTMLAIADAALGTGKRASFDVLVSLWQRDAVGFPDGRKA